MIRREDFELAREAVNRPVRDLTDKAVLSEMGGTELVVDAEKALPARVRAARYKVPGSVSAASRQLAVAISTAEAERATARSYINAKM